jgi:membrane-bound serine protease (ClpP class)
MSVPRKSAPWAGVPLATMLVALCIGPAGAPLAAQERPVVSVIPIEGMIDMGLAPFVARALQEAERSGAAALVLEINTFGGRLDAAVQIRDALLSSTVPTVAFINRRAISAGALISLAAQRIAITDGGTIGAAAPVQIGAPGSEGAAGSEKTVSYVRKEFRATAEGRGRPVMIAEAMVDADVEIAGVVEKGKLLTLSAEEALLLKVVDFKAQSMASLLEQIGLAGAEIRYTSPNWAERVVRFLTHPVVSSLLLSLAMLGIFVEIRTPGFGFAGALGVAALAAFMGGHWIVQLAGWEEVLLVGAGVILLTLEFLVIPGFGIAGVAGIAALLGGLTMTLVGAGAATVAVIGAMGRVTIAMIVAIGASFVVLQFLRRTPFGRQLVLNTDMAADEGYASAPEGDSGLLGRIGRAHSMLRPAGIADIDGERVDVVSDGELIEAGAEVVVVRVDGNRIVVRRHRMQSEAGKT